MQAAQDITIGARCRKTQYQYTLVDVDTDELDHWAPIFLEKLQSMPAADRRRQRPGRAPARRSKSTVNREVASQLGILPRDDRQHPRRRLRPAHRRDACTPTLNQYHVILEVEPAVPVRARGAEATST